MDALQASKVSAVGWITLMYVLRTSCFKLFILKYQMMLFNKYLARKTYIIASKKELIKSQY
jgi:hypothetical protein